MEDKLKIQKESAFVEEFICPSSPPSRHKKWKLTRTKAGRHITSQKSLEIA